MGIVRSYVDESDTPNSIRGYRILVDEWNSLSNKMMTRELFDKMLNLYASIKIHEHEYNWDMDFCDEIRDNDRYKLKKYDFF